MKRNAILKKITFFVFISLFFVFQGCSKKSKTNPSDYVDDSPSPEFHSNSDEIFEGEKIGIDLTKMKANMVYAEVFNMLLIPDEYNGKLIKVRGNLSKFVPNGKSEEVTTVVVSDALACCQQGLEFKIADDSPLKTQSLPSPDSEIEVVGRFVLTQTEEGFDYFYLDLKSLNVI